MILSLRAALKFHRGSNKNFLVSLMSLISVFSIAIGITIFIIALSVMHGFKYELSKRILAIVPHGEIKPINTSFVDWKKTLMHIRQIPNVISASPYVSFSGVIKFHNKWHLIYVRSIDLENNLHEEELLRFLDSDNWKYFCENKEQILLGKGVSDALNIKVGDWVTILIASNNNLQDKILSSKEICLQVSGIFNLNSQLDHNFAIVSLFNAQHYNDKISEIEGISIRVRDVFSIDKVISTIKTTLTDHINVLSWMDIYGYIYQDIQMVRIIIYLSMVLIMGIFCFNVVATLILSIKDKSYDIAILRSLGARNVLIRYVFFWYGLIIYIISSILGMGFGIVIALNLTNLSMRYNNLFKKDIFSEGVYFVNFLPSRLSIWDILLVLGTTLLLGILISWYLSLKTKDLNLSQILK